MSDIRRLSANSGTRGRLAESPVWTPDRRTHPAQPAGGPARARPRAAARRDHGRRHRRARGRQPQQLLPALLRQGDAARRRPRRRRRGGRRDAADAGRAAADPPQALVAYLEHVDENAELYRRVLGDHGSAVVVARLRARIEAIVRDGVVAVRRTRRSTALPLDIVAAGIAGSVLGVARGVARARPAPARRDRRRLAVARAARAGARLGVTDPTVTRLPRSASP